MAALDSLRLAAAPDAAVTTKLRLRGNANALNRSGRRVTTAATTPLPRREPPPPQPGPNVERAWADAMTDVAAECARNVSKLPPHQRRAELIRINALHATARQIKRKQPQAAAG
jgi:hypothetical protein